MKLKPIALAIPMVLAAGSLSAAEIYNTGGNSVELSGNVKAFGSILSKDVEAEKKGFHVKTSAGLSLTATHEIDDVSKLVGSFGLGAADFKDRKLAYEHADLGTISLGATGNSFGAIEKAGAGNGDNLYAIGQGGVGAQGIRFQKSIEDLSLSVNYETNEKADYKSNYAASAAYAQDDFSVAVAFGSDGDKATSTGIGADMKFGDIKLGAAFVSFEDAGSIKVNADTELSLGAGTTGHSYALTATYSMDDVTVYASYQAASGELEKVDFDGTTMYAGADFKFTDAITTYLVVQQGEYEHGTTKDDATNIKFGANYSF
jgi:outer membrane pore protein F